MAEEKKAKAAEKRPSALKRDIQSVKRQVRNKSFKSKVNTAIRTLENAIAKKEGSANENLNLVYSLMDKGVKTGVFKLNKANRVKSRFTKRLQPAK